MENKQNHLVKSSSKEQTPKFISVIDNYRKTLKVKDFTPDNRKFWTTTRAALSKCSLILGSKTAPSDEEYFILKEILIENFKDFSPQEILNAFNLLIAGKLNVEADKYGKISAAYLGKVLIAYRELRHKELAKELKDAPKAVKIASEEEKKNIRKEFLNNCLIKPFKNIEIKEAFEVDKHSASILFQLFRRVNLIEVSEEDEEKYKKLAFEDLKQEAAKDNKSYKPMQNFFEGVRSKDKSMDKKILERACGMYFCDYALKLYENKKDINLIAEKL